MQGNHNNLQTPSLQTLRQTCTKLFNEKKIGVVNIETSGMKDLVSRISINELQLKVKKGEKESQIESYVGENLYSLEQKQKVAQNRKLAL